MEFNLSNRASTLKTSVIREILKITEQPDVISFAGGLPAPEFFPIEELSAINNKILHTEGYSALQYSPTEGFGLLRDMICSDRMAKAGVETNREEILITAGSQQGIEFCARLFLDDGDYIISENPSYLGAINAFNTYNVKYLTVPMDEHGMIMEELENVLKLGHKPKFIYTIPDFQNPTGITMSVERRKRMVELAKEYSIPIIEDNPYGDVIFSGVRNPAIKSFDQDGIVIFLGTFSKTLCPGLRIGWICAEHELLTKFIMLKQISDLQCNTLTQREVGYFLKEHDLEEHVKNIIQVYKKRSDLMQDCMKEYFPSEVKYTHPDGGLFTWVELPENIDTRELLVIALKDKVAFVPGEPFFPNGEYKNFLRLNYSNMPEDKIRLGIERLGHAIRAFMHK